MPLMLVLLKSGVRKDKAHEVVSVQEQLFKEEIGR